MTKILGFFVATAVVLSCNSDSTSDTAAKPETSIDQTTMTDSTTWYEYQNSQNGELDSISLHYNGKNYRLVGLNHNGEFILEGDMKLNPLNSSIRRGTEYLNKDSERRRSDDVSSSTGVALTIDLWPIQSNKIQIQYKISPSFENTKRIQDAIEMWENTSLVNFIPANPQSRSYVVFELSKYTRSYIGCIGRPQTVEISDKARAGNIAHEIGHLLGLFHEHSRSDRNNYIRIKCPDDINYKLALEIDKAAKDFLYYDLYSIMHYPPTDNCMEVLVKGLPIGIPGQRKEISTGDKKTIAKLYSLSD